MSKIVKNYIYNISYQIVITILPLITIPYLTRTLGATNLGIERYIESVATLFTTFGLLGLVWYSNRAIAYIRDDKKKLSLCFAEIFCMRVLLLVATLVMYLCLYHNTEYALYYKIFAIYIAGAFLDTSWFFIGIEEMKAVVSCNYIVKLAYTILLFFLVKKPEDLIVFVLLTSASMLVSAIILLSKIRKYITRFSWRELNLKRHLLPAITLFLPQAASQLYVQCDKIMIKQLAENISYVSFYTENEKIVKVPVILATALTTVLMPRIANEFAVGNSKNIKRYIQTAFICTFFVLMPCCIGMMATAQTFVPIFLGPEFQDTYNILIFLCPSMIFIGLSSVTGIQYLVALNKTKELTISYVAAAVCNLTLNIILIPKYNAVGATIGTVIAELLVFLIQYHFLKKDLGSLIDKKIMGFVLSLSIFMGIFVSICGILTLSPIIKIVVQVSVGIVIYGLGAMVLYWKIKKQHCL